ncbi:MAG: hypothetical protein KGI27_05010 [Thaumarchaeota archaeon]|nr:hypothetical protein [Nitrososphaerota archaeon]
MDNSFLSSLKPLFKHGVEYIGIINERGRLVDAIYKNQMDMPGGQLEMFFMGIRLQCSMQKDFDGMMSTLSHILMERENLKTLCIPILSFIVLVVMGKKANHRKIVEKITHAVTRLDKIQ